jgi:hypothetical protein
MTTRNLPGGKGRPALKADSLTTICDPNVWKMLQRITGTRIALLFAFTPILIISSHLCLDLQKCKYVCTDCGMGLREKGVGNGRWYCELQVLICITEIGYSTGSGADRKERGCFFLFSFLFLLSSPSPHSWMFSRDKPSNGVMCDWIKQMDVHVVCYNICIQIIR